MLLKVFNWGPLVIHELGPKATGKSMSFQAMAKKLLKSIWQRECNNPRDSANASTVTSPFIRYCIRLWHSGIQLQKVFSVVAESKVLIFYISLSSYKRNTHTTWRKAKRLELCYLFYFKVVNSFNCQLEIWCRKILVLGLTRFTTVRSYTGCFFNGILLDNVGFREWVCTVYYPTILLHI